MVTNELRREESKNWFDSNVIEISDHFYEAAMWLSSSEGSKPPSLPRHWPRSTPEDLEASPKRVVMIGEEQTYSFCDNFVKTSKYELYSFLPKFLLEVHTSEAGHMCHTCISTAMHPLSLLSFNCLLQEFNPKTKVANCYFLLIAALQCFKPISNTNGYPTTLLPLTVVVIVDGIFQVLEDISRHKADAEANASPTSRYNKQSQEFDNVCWYELQVGDFVLINNRCTLPADIIPFAVAEKSDPAVGLCYIETKSLDGETNLKIRNALPITLDKVRIVFFYICSSYIAALTFTSVSFTFPWHKFHPTDKYDFNFFNFITRSPMCHVYML